MIKRANINFGSGNLSLLGKSGGIIALILLSLVLPACNSAEEVTTPETGADIEDVEEETDELIGETVTLSGEVERVISPRGFILQDDELFGGEDVLVVSATDIPLVEGTAAQVTGIVRELTIADVEREYGFDLDPELEVEFSNRPVVVATEATLVPETE